VFQLRTETRTRDDPRVQVRHGSSGMPRIAGRVSGGGAATVGTGWTRAHALHSIRSNSSVPATYSTGRGGLILLMASASASRG
jgi:hypothetical protein